MQRVALLGRATRSAMGRSLRPTESLLRPQSYMAPAIGFGTLSMAMNGRGMGRESLHQGISTYNRPDLIIRRHFSAASDDDSKQTAISGPPKSKIKLLWENYGMVFLGFYGSLYLVTLGSVYEIVALKHVDAQSVVAYMHSVGIDKFVDLTPIATSKAGNFALAWILTKFTEPVRLAFTVSITPTLSRFLGYAPPKPPRQAKGTSSSAEAKDASPSSTRVPEVHHAKPKV